MRRGQFVLKFFAQNIGKENVAKYLCYFHKFLVQDHLHEYLRAVLCCFRLCLYGFYLFVFYHKTVGETQIEIESAVAKQTKKCDFVFFQNILPATIFYHR